MLDVFLNFCFNSLFLVVPVYSAFFIIFISGMVIALILNLLRQFLYRSEK